MLCQFTQTILPIFRGDYLKHPCCFPPFAYSNLVHVTDKGKYWLHLWKTGGSTKIKDCVVLGVKL